MIFLLCRPLNTNLIREGEVHLRERERGSLAITAVIEESTIVRHTAEWGSRMDNMGEIPTNTTIVGGNGRGRGRGSSIIMGRRGTGSMIEGHGRRRRITEVDITSHKGRESFGVRASSSIGIISVLGIQQNRIDTRVIERE